MKFFGLDKGLQFQEYWNLQVPQSLTYFPFYHFKYLYVIYSNTRKDITYIDINQKSHRVIQNSGITLNFAQSTESVGTTLARLGSWIWIYGGRKNNEVTFGLHFDLANFGQSAPQIVPLVLTFLLMICHVLLTLT